MFKVVKIGEKEVPMLAMASVDIYYKHIFGKDPLKEQTKEDADGTDMMELVMKMGFVMAKFAELRSRSKMLALTEDDYVDWIEQFERADLLDLDKLTEIQNVYEGNKETNSESKKKEEQ